MVSLSTCLLAASSAAIPWIDPLIPRAVPASDRHYLPSPTNIVQAAVAPPRRIAAAKALAKPFAALKGPVIEINFPDPCLIYVDGCAHAFATWNRKDKPDLVRVQMAVSTDNITWTYLAGRDALPVIAPWQTGARVWAPDIIRLDDGSFVMYYSDTLISNPQIHCIGAATSKTVQGPYRPLDHPIACPDPKTQGGAIDADGFYDYSSKKRYIIYKVDGNSIGHGGLCSNMVAPQRPTPIMLQEVSVENGITPIGKPIQLLDRTKEDGPLIEAPTMFRTKEGIYFLFYSSSCFTTPNYDVAYATSDKITGPFTRAPRPLAMTGDGQQLVGPGGADITPDGIMVFHGILTPENDANQRQLMIETAMAQKKGGPKPNPPLVRGMYYGLPKFEGRTVTFAE